MWLKISIDTIETLETSCLMTAQHKHTYAIEPASMREREIEDKSKWDRQVKRNTAHIQAATIIECSKIETILNGLFTLG